MQPSTDLLEKIICRIHKEQRFLIFKKYVFTVGTISVVFFSVVITVPIYTERFQNINKNVITNTQINTSTSQISAFTKKPVYYLADANIYYGQR